MASDGPKKGFTVVVAVDGSEFSDYALEFYVKCVHKPDNKVILTHAAHYKSISSAPMDVMNWDPAPQVSEEEEQKTAELKEKLNSLIVKYGIEADIQCVHGDYGPSICTVATDNHADFIVVGCRGKGKISKLLQGSVTDYVAHHSSIPVIIARSKEQIKLVRQKSKELVKQKSKDKS